MQLIASSTISALWNKSEIKSYLMSTHPNHSSGFHQIIRKQSSLIQQWNLHQISAFPQLWQSTRTASGSFGSTENFAVLGFQTPQRPGSPPRALGTWIKRFCPSCAFLPSHFPGIQCMGRTKVWAAAQWGLQLVSALSLPFLHLALMIVQGIKTPKL